MGFFGKGGLGLQDLFGGGQKMPSGYMGGSGIGDGMIERRLDPMASFGGYDQGAAMQGQSGFAPMNAGRPQKKGGFFSKDGALPFVLAGISDFAARRQGGQSSAIGDVLQYKQQQSRLMAEAQQAEQQRMNKRDDYVWQTQYDRANPKPAQPTEFERLLGAGNYTPDQRQAKLRGYVENRVNPPKWFQLPDGRWMQGGGQQEQPTFAGWGDEEGGPASPSPVNFPRR